jgi:hypothetical protein
MTGLLVQARPMQEDQSLESERGVSRWFVRNQIESMSDAVGNRTCQLDYFGGIGK